MLELTRESPGERRSDCDERLCVAPVELRPLSRVDETTTRTPPGAEDPVAGGVLAAAGLPMVWMGGSRTAPAYLRAVTIRPPKARSGRTQPKNRISI